MITEADGEFHRCVSWKLQIIFQPIGLVFVEKKGATAGAA
jgi:hypothetical protein